MPTSFDLALALAIIRGGKPRNPQDAVELADRLDAELRSRSRFATIPTLTVVEAIGEDDALRDQFRSAALEAPPADPGGIETSLRAAAEDHAGLRGLGATDVPGLVVPTILTGVGGGGFALPTLSAALLEHALAEVAWEEAADALNERARS